MSKSYLYYITNNYRYQLIDAREVKPCRPIFVLASCVMIVTRATALHLKEQKYFSAAVYRTDNPHMVIKLAVKK